METIINTIGAAAGVGSLIMAVLAYRQARSANLNAAEAVRIGDVTNRNVIEFGRSVIFSGGGGGGMFGGGGGGGPGGPSGPGGDGGDGNYQA